MSLTMDVWRYVDTFESAARHSSIVSSIDRQRSRSE